MPTTLNDLRKSERAVQRAQTAVVKKLTALRTANEVLDAERQRHQDAVAAYQASTREEGVGHD